MQEKSISFRPTSETEANFYKTKFRVLAALLGKTEAELFEISIRQTAAKYDGLLQTRYGTYDELVLELKKYNVGVSRQSICNHRAAGLLDGCVIESTLEPNQPITAKRLYFDMDKCVAFYRSKYSSEI